MISDDSVNSLMQPTKNDNYFDAVEQLLECKNKSFTKQDALEFFAEYFKNVKKGYHVMFREFKFAMYTPYNRACFVKNFYEAYNYIGFKGEFIRESLHVYENLLISANKTDNFNDSFEVANQDSSNNDNEVSSKALYENIELICAKANYSTPPLAIIKELLNKEKTVQFYEFLNKLSKNESINNLIGELQNAILLFEIYGANSRYQSVILNEEAKEDAPADKIDDINVLFTRSLSKLMDEHCFTNDKRSEVISKLSLLRYNGSEIKEAKSSNVSESEVDGYDAYDDSDGYD